MKNKTKDIGMGSANSEIDKLINESLQFYAQKNYSQSLNLANQVIKTQGPHIRALLIAAKNLQHLGQLQVAANIYDQVIISDKTIMEAYTGLAEIYFGIKDYTAAEKVLLQALSLNQKNFDVLFGLGVLNKLQRNYEGALVFLRGAYEIKPDNRAVLQELCATVYLTDSVDEAQKYYLKFYEKTGKIGNLITARTLVPTVFMSSDEIDIWRNEYKNTLLEFLAQDIIIENPLEDIKQTYFQTLYQNRNNKELSSLYAKLVRKMCPSINYTAPHTQNYVPNAKTKIGFIFRFDEKHVVADSFFLLFEKLYDNEKFEAYIFSTAQVPAKGALWNKYSEKGRAIQLPFNIEQSQKMIAGHKLDIIVHPELGINLLSYYLAYARLAPIQCFFTGIPITSGIDTIDYYISESSVEPTDVQEYFTEKTILMNNKCYMATMKPPADLKNRAQLGLPLDKLIYTAPLKLQKFHPDFDKVIGKLLSKDKNAIYLIFEDKKFLTDKIRSRLATSLDKETFSRILFVPQASKDDFICYLSAVDCLLDSYYYGCGTTGFLAFNYGVPIVTMKKGFLVGGRLAVSFYEKTGIKGLTAETEDEFIDTCIKLANDKPFYNSLKQEILQKKKYFSENEGGFDEFLEIFSGLIKNVNN